MFCDSKLAVEGEQKKAVCFFEKMNNKKKAISILKPLSLTNLLFIKMAVGEGVEPSRGS